MAVFPDGHCQLKRSNPDFSASRHEKKPTEAADTKLRGKFRRALLDPTEMQPPKRNRRAGLAIGE